MKLGILNEFLGLEENYIKACEDLRVDYEVIDIISNNWIDNIIKSKCDGFLVRPSYKNAEWKKMYDEKLYFISEILKKPLYPDYYSLFLYENKRNMSYFLRINNLPMPKTWVFYNKIEALNFLDKYDDFPIIFKPNVGSAALGIKFLNKKQAKKLVKKIFTKWGFFNRGFTKWVKTKYKIKYPLMDDKQFNNILFQEKLDVKWEWRIIRLGDSFFGHQKLAKGKFHSGSGKVGWVKPPNKLLDLVKDITDKNNFRSMDIDIFETNDGNYYINELQAIFGSYLNSQMYVNGKPGRMIYKDKWVFEEGIYNTNGSCDLRVKDFVEILKKRG